VKSVCLVNRTNADYKVQRPDEFLNWDNIQKMRYSWNVACEAMRLAPPAIGAFSVHNHN